MCKKITAVIMVLAMVLGCVSAFAETTAQEKVYVVLDAAGTVKSITDIIHLENEDGLDVITDRTRLADVESLDGPANFTLDGETLTWQADGSDIIYQGTSDREPAVLPVITATLDGEEIPVSEVKDRVGEVTMTVSYKAADNMPALAVTAMLLPDEGVTGLKTENALVLKEMGQEILVGWGIPGVNEALKLPSSFTVSFHGDHANLKWAMTVITSDPLAMACQEIDSRLGMDLNTEVTNAETILTALKDGETLPMVASDARVNMLVMLLNQLNDSLTRLDNSAKTLAEGAKTLSEGAASLKTGADQASAGAAALKTSAATLSGSTATAAKGAASLNTALETLTKNNETLVIGADQMFAGMLDAANAQLALSGLSEAGAALPELTAENYAETLDGAIASLGTSPEAEEALKQLTAIKEQLTQMQTLADGIKTYTTGAAQAAEGAKTLSTGMGTLQEGAAALSSGAADLATGTAGVAAGADTVNTGAASLQSGAEQLHVSGTQALKASITGAETTVANLLLPYVQETLPEILDIYDQTRDHLSSSGYDLHGDDIAVKTIYIMRTDLQ